MATFSILTFNCFGSWTPTTRRRLLTLARELDYLNSTVVCLQEVLTHRYLQLLVQACQHYPAQAYVPARSGPRGGLVTLAQAPLTQTSFTLYRERGRWYSPALLDRRYGKGILSAQLEYAGIPIVVLNTHLIGHFGKNWHPKSHYTRTTQAQLIQLTELVRTLPNQAIVIVAGDFNISRGNWLYDEFLTASGLIDPLAGDSRPTYRPYSGILQRYALPIDFILLRLPPLPDLQMSHQLCFSEKLPLMNGRCGYLSDHCGILFQLKWD